MQNESPAALPGLEFMLFDSFSEIQFLLKGQTLNQTLNGTANQKLVLIRVALLGGLFVSSRNLNVICRSAGACL